jgi:simple sugar transport system permease protein
MSVARNVVLVFVLSGALAGLAGGVQVTSVTHALDPSSLDPGLGLGYTGIVVAALARFSVAATVPVAFFVAALLTSGPALELVSVPASVIVVLQGMILLLVGSGQFFLRYRVRFAGLGRSAS